MEFEQFTYSVENYQCIELYPFNCKNKRYFQAYQQEKSYRMIVYPIQMVKQQELLEYLAKLKTLVHPLLGKIIEVKQKTVLVSQGNQLKKQDVIAVLIDNQKDPGPCFHHFYESLLEYGPYTQKIARTYLLKLINLVSYMHSQGIKNGFYPEDLYLERQEFELRVDNYGDRQFFKIHSVTLPDSWQLGNVLFTFFNRYPPYSQPSSTDKFFLLLKNGNYDKFWEKSKRRNNTPLKVIEFLNKSFVEQCSWNQLQNDQWLRQTQSLTQNELAEQMKQILQVKQKQRIQQDLRNQASRQRYQEAIRNRHNLNRGSELNEMISLFIHKFNAEESSPRKANEFSDQSFNGVLIPAHYDNENMIYAHILTLLESNHRQDITLCEVQDQRRNIMVRLDGIAEDELQIDVKVILDVVQGKKQQKYVRVQCIEGSMIERLWVNSYFKKLFSQV